MKWISKKDNVEESEKSKKDSDNTEKKVKLNKIFIWKMKKKIKMKESKYTFV